MLRNAIQLRALSSATRHAATSNRQSIAITPRQAQALSDMKEFVAPLSMLTSSSIGSSAANDARLQYVCPFCNDGVRRAPDATDRHVAFSHQLRGASQTDFFYYNKQTLESAADSSVKTDVTLVVDLANLELAYSTNDFETLSHSSQLKQLFALHSVTCLVTHEIMIPFDASAQKALSCLIQQHPGSQFFTQFACDGMDSGDKASAAAILHFLSHRRVDSKVVLLSKDWGQRMSLQHLFDPRRVEVINLPKSVAHWRAVLEDAFVKRF